MHDRAQGVAGPVLVTAFDRRTGYVVEATHVMVPDVVPGNLHPVLLAHVDHLLQRADGKPDAYVYFRDPFTGEPVHRGGFPHFSVPGAHGEVQAASRLLFERERAGLTVTPEALKELTFDSRIVGGRFGGEPAPFCPNCSAILSTAESLGGKIPVDFYLDRPGAR
jgi:hypothetical protein